MDVKFLDLVGQYRGIKSEIDSAISAVIENSAFIGGQVVSEFESNFADFQGVQHCIGVGNGTDALEIIIEAMELPKGSAVLIPANSFIASSEAVTRNNLSPIFVDIDPQTYTVDLDTVEQALKSTSNVSAVMAVHLYGQPCDMTSIIEISERYDLRIIEDCAQAHGAEYRQRRVGGIGDAGAFSFYPGKNLGAYGDGGAIVTNDRALATRCRMIANHGRLAKYDHEFEGRNSRLDGLQAAVLTVKLNYLEAWIERRIAIAQRYNKLLAFEDNLVLPTIKDDVRHVFHLYVVRAKERDELQRYLAEKNIQTGIHYPQSLPALPAYAGPNNRYQNLHATVLTSELLSLPIGEHLDDQQVDYVCEAVREFYGNA